MDVIRIEKELERLAQGKGLILPPDGEKRDALLEVLSEDMQEYRYNEEDLAEACIAYRRGYINTDRVSRISSNLCLDLIRAHKSKKKPVDHTQDEKPAFETEQIRKGVEVRFNKYVQQYRDTQQLPDRVYTQYSMYCERFGLNKWNFKDKAEQIIKAREKDDAGRKKDYQETNPYSAIIKELNQRRGNRVEIQCEFMAIKQFIKELAATNEYYEIPPSAELLATKR